MQGSRHGPGGEAELRSFGDDAKIAIGCVVDQRGDSKQAAEVGIVSLRNLLISIFQFAQIAFLIDDLVTAGVERLRLARANP